MQGAVDIGSMDRVTVAIVGGGLAGLQSARLLQAKGVAVGLVEAREWLGGRILSADVDGSCVPESAKVVAICAMAPWATV